MPLALKLWSSRSPGFKGENDEVLKIIRAVYAATGGKCTVVYDRGGDKPAFYDYFIEENRDFIVRLKGRSVLSWGGMHEVHDLARQPTTPRRSSSCRASPSSSTPTTDSRFGRETPKTTSRNALQPLSMRVRRISALKKWVNSRKIWGATIDLCEIPQIDCFCALRIYWHICVLGAGALDLDAAVLVEYVRSAERRVEPLRCRVLDFPRGKSKNSSRNRVGAASGLGSLTLIERFVMMIKFILKISFGFACILFGGYGLWLCATGTFEEGIDSLPDYDYIAEIRELESVGRLGEAEHLADFVLEGSSITNRDEVAAFREKINRKRTAFWNRAYRAGKGFVVGDGVSLEELSGAMISDFLLWGDIRDLAKQGYYKATGKETDPVVAALASVGVLTSIASFWVADPAEPVEVAADVSLSWLKTFRKMGHLSRRFCGVLVDACRETIKTKSASKGLKEIVVGMKGLFDGAGAARASAVIKHVDDLDSLKAVSTMSKRMPEPTAIFVRMHGREGVKVLGKLAGAEDGAIVLEKAARKGPKALGKLLTYTKYGARTAKSFWLEHPQELFIECAKTLGRMKLAIISFLAVVFGFWRLKVWRLANRWAATLANKQGN